MIHCDTIWYTFSHYFTLFLTISHCDTPGQQRLNIAASAPPSRHCHYLAPPLPSLVVLVAPLPPHLTGCSVHLEGIMLSTSVERAPGKHVKSPGGVARASKRNNQTAKSSGGDSSSGSLSEIASCASCAAMTYPMKIQPCAFWIEAIVDHLEAHRFLQ